MTGIERLRGVAGFWRENKLDDIADQIKREQGGRVSRMRVLAVVTDMERHVSGVEGAEDSPVARWARELREALGGNGRDPAADVSVSACDLLPQEDREAIAWVRYHGGRDEARMELDNLRGAIAETCARLGVERSGDLTADAQGIWRAIDRLKSLLGDSVPRAAYERHLARRQRQIDESHAALRRRNARIAELNHRACDLTRENAELRRRAMPEGCEWPRYESGELVQIGDDVSRHGKDFEANVIALYCDGSFSLNFRAYSKGERVKRPVAPSVPGADGEPLEVGQTVYDVDAEADTPLTVVEVSSDLVRCEYTWKDGKTYRPCYPPDQLTHTKPEPPDTWQRIEEDARGLDSGVDRELFTHTHEDIVRRCRALAERERGE